MLGFELSELMGLHSGLWKRLASRNREASILTGVVCEACASACVETGWTSELMPSW